jgi:rare lipoprotein A
MRRRIAQGLAMALLVGFGVAQGPTSSWSLNYKAAETAGLRVPVTRPNARPYQVGTASWYGEDFEGKPTASGEPFNMYELTAAHPTLPLGTLVKVTNLKNRRAVVVRINDRGPYVRGRKMELSKRAAETIGLTDKGVGRATIQRVESKTQSDDSGASTASP